MWGIETHIFCFIINPITQSLLISDLPSWIISFISYRNSCSSLIKWSTAKHAQVLYFYFQNREPSRSKHIYSTHNWPVPQAERQTQLMAGRVLDCLGIRMRQHCVTFPGGSFSIKATILTLFIQGSWLSHTRREERGESYSLH